MGRRKIGIESIVGNPHHHPQRSDNRPKSSCNSSSSSHHHVSRQSNTSKGCSRSGMSQREGSTTSQRSDREYQLAHTLKRLEANRMAQKQDVATVHRLLYEKQRKKQQEQQRLIAAWWHQQQLRRQRRKAQQQQQERTSRSTQVHRATKSKQSEAINVIDLRGDDEDQKHTDDEDQKHTEDAELQKDETQALKDDNAKGIDHSPPSAGIDALPGIATFADAVSFSETEEEMVAKSLCSISAGIGIRKEDRVPTAIAIERPHQPREGIPPSPPVNPAKSAPSTSGAIPATTTVENLSNADLQRLVDILKISHPQAVASALALIEPSKHTTMVEACQKRSMYSIDHVEPPPQQKRRKINDDEH